MAIKFNKENKVIESKTSIPGKWCSITLGIQIALTLLLGGLAVAPALSTFAGIALGVILVLGSTLVTAATAGIIWTSAGVRNFFKNGFKLTGNILDGTQKIVPTLKPYIVAIALPLFIVSAVGFVYNLIYFIKHGKANKGRFIASCVLLGIALINLIATLIIYLK